METHRSLDDGAATHPQPALEGCPRCGEPYVSASSVIAAALGGVPVRRCLRCGAMATADEGPPRFVNTCESCGLPFLHDRGETAGEPHCSDCSSGSPSMGPADPEVSAATEAEVRAALDGHWSFVQAGEMSSYLDRLIQELAAKVEGAPSAARVILVDDPVLRCVALPSGTVLLSLGLLGFLEDEAELAFVLSHELSHVASGETATRMVRSGFGAVADEGGAPRSEAWADAALDLSRLGYGRDREREADLLAVRTMLEQRYDPHAALRFLRRLEARISDGSVEFAEVTAAYTPPAHRIRLIEGTLHGRVGREPVLRVNREVFRRAAGPDALSAPFERLRLAEVARSRPRRDRRIPKPVAWILAAAAGVAAVLLYYWLVH